MSHYSHEILLKNVLFLFLIQPNGKSFMVRYLGKKLRDNGKKVWMHYQPYVSRHWCAVSRLIEQKVKIDNFDVFPVKNWLGHEKIETTMNYIRHAEQYYKQAPYDWIKRVLKYHYNEVEENTLKKSR